MQDLKNAKKTVKMLGLTFLLIALVIGSAFAASVILSNTLHQDVTVPDQALSISSVQALPDAPAKGSQYEIITAVDFSVSASDAYMTLTITKIGISASDVTVIYAGSALTFVDSGNVLTAEFSIPATDGNVSILVTFNVAGSYATDIVVEATA